MVVGFVPWDFLDLSLTGQQEYSVTYDWPVNPGASRGTTAINQGERIPFLSPGSRYYCSEGLCFALSGQAVRNFIRRGAKSLHARY